MEPSELPPFPALEPPAKPTPQPAGRRGTMLLQALFLLAIWSGVYILHEQTTAITAAEQKAREREQAERDRETAIRQINGRWVGVGNAWIISFQTETFVLELDPKATWWGNWRFENGVYHLTESGLDRVRRARIIGDELVIERPDGNEASWTVVWRFRRPGKE